MDRKTYNEASNILNAINSLVAMAEGIRNNELCIGLITKNNEIPHIDESAKIILQNLTYDFLGGVAKQINDLENEFEKL